MSNNKGKSEQQIKLTQIGSGIGKTVSQNKTLIGLGLGKMHKSVVLANTPSIIGMVKKVKHLLKVEIVN